MSDEQVPIRLIKVAKEFNVGTSTIVDDLARKGHKIDSNPNTKLTPEQYALLRKLYDVDKKVKIEAEKKGLEYSVRRETITTQDKKAHTRVEKEIVNDELMIKNVQLDYHDNLKAIKKPTVEAPTPQPQPTAKIETPEIKPIATPTPEPKKQEPIVSVTVEHKPVSEEPKVIAVETPKPRVEPIPEPKPEPSKPTQAEPIEVKQPPKESTDVEVKVVKETIIQEKPSQNIINQPTEPKKEIIQAEAPKVVAPPEPKAEQTEETANDTGGIKVFGKLDLDSMNLRTKPDKKTKEQRKREREETYGHQKKTGHETPTVDANQQTLVFEEPKTESTEKVETPKPEVIESIIETPVAPVIPAAEKLPDNFLKTQYQKIEGPVILGSMQLPDPRRPEKKKPVASSSDEKLKSKKKKRKRIGNEPQTGNQQPNTGQGQNRTNQQGGGNQQGGTNQQGGSNQQRQGQGGQGQVGHGQQRQGSGATHGPRPQQGTTQQGGPQRPGQNQHGPRSNQQSGRFKDKKPVKEAPKVEPTPEDIERQIKETLARLTSGGKSKSSKYRRAKRDMISEKMAEEQQKLEDSKKTLQVTEFLTANELASMMDIHVNQVISTCMSLGLFVAINQRLDAETITLVADEFGFSVEFISANADDVIEDQYDENPDDYSTRSPIVTVMGHVDHGKTKLLDYIRNANVVAGEAGGITQHIGAYEVQLDNGKRITFLDTPGHEAFTAMRARGAKITDVAIIVIAADDSVMPQTREAINHALAANVPIVFAFNKIDKPTANTEKIREELSKMNILVEDWGGKYQCQEISAKSGIGVENLLEKVLLEAEMLDLKANPKRPASGTVIESMLDKGRGYVVKLLVQNGALRQGDLVLAGTCYGKVKAMYNERNQIVKVAGPSAPIMVLGLNGAPQAGDKFNVFIDEREAKTLANKRLQLQREVGLRTQKHITLDEIGRRIAIGDFKELNIIVKGDVDGSVEALSDALLKLSNEEIQVNVIHKSVGAVTETDVMLASASNAVIIGFQVRPSASARKLAETEQIDIRLYSIIYKAIEEIKDAMVGMLSPVFEEKITSNLEVREVFNISKVGNIAGCLALEGTMTRHTKVRVIRDGIVVYSGHLGSLKRFKDDVKEVKVGQECGLNIDRFNDIKVGDIIEGYEEIEVKRTIK